MREMCCSFSRRSRRAAGLPETIFPVPIASWIESRSRLAAASAHTRKDDKAQSCRNADAGLGGVLSKMRATLGVSADGGDVSQELMCSRTGPTGGRRNARKRRMILCRECAFFGRRRKQATVLSNVYPHSILRRSDNDPVADNDPVERREASHGLKT
jgi:hypothetical protein